MQFGYLLLQRADDAENNCITFFLVIMPYGVVLYEEEISKLFTINLFKPYLEKSNYIF